MKKLAGKIVFLWFDYYFLTFLLTANAWLGPTYNLYGKTLREAIAVGVEVITYSAEIKPELNRIVLNKKLIVKI